MQISDKVYSNNAIETFKELSSELRSAQEAIATGKRIQNVSDDPLAAARLSVLKEQLSRADQYLRNIDIANARLSLAENALGTLSNLLTRSYELALQGANATNAKGRTAIATELGEMLHNIRELGNSSDESGRQLFAGFKNTTPAFELDVTGSTKYVGDRGAHTVKISDEMTIQTSLDGATIFERVPSTSGGFVSLFSLVEGMLSDLNNGNGDNLPIDGLKNAINHVSDQRAFLGAQQNKGEQQASLLENRKFVLTENVSDLEDADLSELVTRMQTLMLNQQGAQNAFARISQLSLFDYLR